MSLNDDLSRIFGEAGRGVVPEDWQRAGGTFAISQVYLPDDKGFDGLIWAVTPQVMAGHPVLMWREDGILVFVAGDPNRHLEDATWRRALVMALMRWLGDRTTEE
jgi:hypothetical protein